jgi:DNA-binding response OmpR family regulator
MNKNILFINDYTATSIVPDIVSQAGYGVDISLKLELALKHLDIPSYDLIILVESPYAESWTACENIRQSTALPLIVISTNASTETCVKAINAGADYFMRKPFGPMELLARINSILQRVSYHQPMPLVS